MEIVPIFVGGGTRLPAHIGILQALNELGIGHRHLVGVSGGSIVMSLYAAGWPVADIAQLAWDTDFARFRGFSLLRLLKDGGLSSGDNFEQWMDDLLEGRRFADLQQDLHILATDVQGGGPVIFSRQLTPEVRISEAVRCSMSIPLLFSFKPFRNKLLVDGAILAEDALHKDWAGDGTPVISFRLKSEHGGRSEPRRYWFPVARYIMLLIRTFMTALSREYVNADFWHSTVVINTGDISPVDFHLSRAQKQQLYQQGYQTAMTVLPLKLKRLAAAQQH